MPAEHNTLIRAPEIVIFEGILALHDEQMRDLYDLKVFVDADADVRLARRIKRDMESRGRDLGGILEQYERFVKPATEVRTPPTRPDARRALTRPRAAAAPAVVCGTEQALRRHYCAARRRERRRDRDARGAHQQHTHAARAAAGGAQPREQEAAAAVARGVCAGGRHARPDARAPSS